MNDNWIYIGADINDHHWSKVGKTTRGLHTRHISSQNPGYFIYTAYNLVNGNVHEIERNLLNYLEFEEGVERQYHFSTGSKSECFLINPLEMSWLVESFIERHYSSCVAYETLYDGISRYQCPSQTFWIFDPEFKNYQESDLPSWCDQDIAPTSDNLNLSYNQYFTGNQVEYETDLGNGYFIDHETGMEGYRDEDGNIDWKEWK